MYVNRLSGKNFLLIKANHEWLWDAKL